MQIKLNRSPLAEQIRRDHDKGTVWFLSLWAREWPALPSVLLTTSVHRLPAPVYWSQTARRQGHRSLMPTPARHESRPIPRPQTKPAGQPLSADVFALV